MPTFVRSTAAQQHSTYYSIGAFLAFAFGFAHCTVVTYSTVVSSTLARLRLSLLAKSEKQKKGVPSAHRVQGK